MTLLVEWISPSVLRTLALSLLHFLWQGAALAALASVALAFCRGASSRYALAVVTLVAMLLSPACTFFILHAQEDSTPQVVSFTANAEVRPAVNRAVAVPSNVLPNNPWQSQIAPFSLLLLVEAWFAGVVLLSFRSIGGFFLVERLRRRESACVTDEILELCLELQDRMGISRMVRYCQSLHLEIPVVVGWVRPVILLPVSAVTGLSQVQLEAVIAHELAHIRRYDAFINLFQVAVETLLFYHPAVWWLGRRLRSEREHCCDDAAVAVCGSPVTYARALALLAEMKPSPQLAMALNGCPLVERVARLLGSGRESRSLRGANLSAGVLCLSIALLAGTAFVGNAHKLRAQAPPAPSAVSAPSRPASTLPPTAPDGAFIVRPAESSVTPSAPSAPEPAAEPASLSGATTEAIPTAAPTPQGNPQQPKQSYVDSLKDAGLTNLTADELISLKIQDVTADYVRSMVELGIKPDSDDLVGLKIQGVTPDYVKQMRAATGQNLDADALIGMKIQGVSPDYVHQMHDLGLKTEADDLIGMKIQGVTPAYVKEMRDLGLKVDCDELVAMKVQGVTPDYVKQMRAATGENLDSDALIGMKIQGVTPAYLKELQDAGFKVDSEEAMAAKVQGITPEFIATARSHGFKDLTLDKLIALKHAGVLEPEK